MTNPLSNLSSSKGLCLMGTVSDGEDVCISCEACPLHNYVQTGCNIWSIHHGGNLVLQVVMYDEPTAGLDPVASTVVEDLVRSLRVSHTAGTPQGQDSGGIAAYIVVTHQHSTIRRSVDRIIFLHEVLSLHDLSCLHHSWR